jgi:hypothetical protein
MGADRLDRGALSRAYSPYVGKGIIRGECHLAPQGVHFPCNVPLGRAADAAIARKVTNPVQAHRDAGRAKPNPCARKRGFNPGMPGSHHNNVKFGHGLHCTGVIGA